MSAFESILALETERRALLDKIRSNPMEILREEFTQMMIANGDAILGIRAWTPGFNDGEPCSHLMVVNEDVVDSFTDTEFTKAYFKAIGHTAASYDKLNYQDRNNVPRPFSSETTKSILTLTHTLHDLLSTNWQISMWKTEDGKIEFLHDDYDCGY